MTHTIVLDDKTEDAISRRARKLGVSAEDLIVRIASESVVTEEAGAPKPKTGAELLEALEAAGVLGGYGDPAIDSPELARRLRARFQWRKHDPLRAAYELVEPEEVSAFVSAHANLEGSLIEALPVIEGIFGDAVKPRLVVAPDPEGNQFDQLLALIPVSGDIGAALEKLTKFRRWWYSQDGSVAGKLSFDVEVI